MLQNVEHGDGVEAGLRKKEDRDLRALYVVDAQLFTTELGKLGIDFKTAHLPSSLMGVGEKGAYAAADFQHPPAIGWTQQGENVTVGILGGFVPPEQILLAETVSAAGTLFVITVDVALGEIALDIDEGTIGTGEDADLALGVGRRAGGIGTGRLILDQRRARASTERTGHGGEFYRSEIGGKAERMVAAAGNRFSGEKLSSLIRIASQSGVMRSVEAGGV